MPFQVSVSYKINEAPPVILITAGADQQISCATSVVLTAVVDEPGNLTGHTLEWEQLTGAPVILSCPTCLTTTYALVGLTDKSFRFWIDKGVTNKEQYDDVFIFHTPTSYVPLTGQIADPDAWAGVPSDSPECLSIIITASPQPPVLQSAQVEAGLALLWDVPPRVELQPFIVQYTVYEDGVPVQTTPVGAERKYDGATSAIYSIFTEFSVNGQYSSEFSCERDYIGDLELPNILMFDDFIAPTSQIANPELTLVKYGFVVLKEPESTMPLTGQIAAPEVVVTKYGNAVISDTESDMPLTGQIATPTLDITRYNSGGIGG